MLQGAVYKRKGGENPKTIPKRDKRTERIQNSAEAMKAKEEMKSHGDCIGSNRKFYVYSMKPLKVVSVPYNFGLKQLFGPLLILI